MTSVLIRDIKRKNQPTEEGTTKTEAVMQLQAQECRHPPESGRGKEQFSLPAPRGSAVLQDFELLIYTTVRE